MTLRTRLAWLAGGAVLVSLAILVGVIFAYGGHFNSPFGPRKYVIAVASSISATALDDLDRGMRDQLSADGYVDGKNIEIIERNANGQKALIPVIAQELASRNPDVMVPITTPMTQAVLKVAKSPIVFASVTDPVGAGVVHTLAGEPGITGASDAWPYKAQMELIHEITPGVRRLGVLFDPGDAAGRHGVDEIRKLAATMGFTVVEGPVNSTGDMYPVAQGLVGRVDAFYLSSDNTAVAGMAGALRVAIQNRIPYYVGESGSVQHGGLATVSVGYYEHGRHTAKLIEETLRGERNIPIVVENGTEIAINTKAAALMGVTIPPEVLNRATHVYNAIQ